MEKKKISLLLVGVLLVVCVSIGISYAVWSLNLKQEGTNTIVTGCFNVTFSGINDINLQSAYPITDEEGASLTPYEFTITNTCEDAATYQIDLEILNNSTLTELGIIRELLQEKGSTGTSKLLTSNNVVDKTLDNANSSYKLNIGTLGAKESKTFELRLWMDEDTEAVESVMNKTLNSKITVITSIFIPRSNVLMSGNIGTCAQYSYYNCNQNYLLTSDRKNEAMNLNLTKVIFESSMKEYTNSLEVRDLSIDQDGSVLGYFVPIDNSEKYELHIQANGKIILMDESKYPFTISNSEYLSPPNVEFEGFDNIDVSNVTDMNHMFHLFTGSNIDIKSWDISNVIDISYMFSSIRSDASIDFGEINFSKVSNMSHMFAGSGFTNLDLNFSTSNVTDMSSMFERMPSLTNLNISNFDTSKVTNMSSMFESSRNLTTITYGPKFVYKNNATVTDMFNSCPANKPTDTSWEGVLS